MLKRHRGPLTADLRRFYGLRLVTAESDIAAGNLTVGELADYAGHLPPGSAVDRATDPEWGIDNHLIALREVAYWSNVAVWQKTEDAQKRKNIPERLFLTAEEKAAIAAQRREDDTLVGGISPTVVSLAEARRRLG